MNTEIHEQISVDLNNPYMPRKYLPVLLLLEPRSKSLEPEPSIFIEPIDPKAARVFMLTFCRQMKIEVMIMKTMKTPP